MKNTLDEVQYKMAEPRLAKYKPYLNSFWSLTPDEQDRVKLAHAGIREYLELLSIEMDLIMKIIMGTLQVGDTGLGLALQAEDLGDTLKMVTFNEKHLSLMPMGKE